jgi:hypothetical protein
MLSNHTHISNKYRWTVLPPLYSSCIQPSGRRLVKEVGQCGLPCRSGLEQAPKCKERVLFIPGLASKKTTEYFEQQVRHITALKVGHAEAEEQERRRALFKPISSSCHPRLLNVHACDIHNSMPWKSQGQTTKHELLAVGQHVVQCQGACMCWETLNGVCPFHKGGRAQAAASGDSKR